LFQAGFRIIVSLSLFPVVYIVSWIYI